jgi:glycosyltransferase involved in cell wall biosynthesis
LKILYSIDTLSSGGAQRQAVELAVHMAKRPDVEVRFSAYHEHDFFIPRLEEAGVPLHILPKRWMIDPAFPSRLRALLREHPVDLIHAYLHPPIFWALAAMRGLQASERPALVAAERNDRIARNLAERMFHTYIYRSADCVTVNASYVRQEIERKCGVAPERIHYIPNGIDLDTWDRQLQASSRVLLDPDRFNVLVVGRLAPQKNHELLVEALGQIDRSVRDRWTVWLVGVRDDDPRSSSALRERIAQQGLDQIIRMQPPVRSIAPIMGRASVLVLPSRHEGFPNVVLEAMASRLPIVATRVGDVPEMLVDGESGWIVEPGSAEGLAAAMLRVHEMSASDRERMAQAARSQVERAYSIDVIAERHIALYRSLLSSDQGRAAAQT